MNDTGIEESKFVGIPDVLPPAHDNHLLERLAALLNNCLVGMGEQYIAKDSELFRVVEREVGRIRIKTAEVLEPVAVADVLLRLRLHVATEKFFISEAERFFVDWTLTKE